MKSIKILTKEELAKSYDLKGQIYDLISSGNNVFLDIECTAVNVEQAVARKNLLKYCELDTYAMVKIFLKLIELSK